MHQPLGWLALVLLFDATPRMQYRGRFLAAAPELDPVMIAILAIDHVGPATVRAVASGIEVRVTAPDDATAAVFRTALANTARRRSTDRLVRIMVG
jgi:hypothetical protein